MKAKSEVFLKLLILPAAFVAMLGLFLFVKTISVITRQEIKREVIGKSYKEGEYTAFITEHHFVGNTKNVIKNPDTYYLIVKIYYDNNTFSVDYISVDKETYDKN